jgi:alpha-L-rhamnosidase
MAAIQDVRFEHYRPENTLVVDETKPRISWKYDSESAFHQHGYNIEVAKNATFDRASLLGSINVTSSSSHLVPWPLDQPLRSRQRVFVRVQGISAEEATTAWSDSAVLETGLMDPEDWQMQRIASPWTEDKTKPQAEKLFRKLFELKSEIKSARLYITSQGVYEAEINGKHVGDFFLAPGWTEYNDRLQYQTYDVSDLLVAGKNCIGVRIAEGWYNGRIGFEGGRRNLWGTRNTLMAQLELKMNDGTINTVVSDASWIVTSGPILLAEIYDGEKYDATKKFDGWGPKVGFWRTVRNLARRCRLGAVDSLQRYGRCRYIAYTIHEYAAVGGENSTFHEQSYTEPVGPKGSSDGSECNFTVDVQVHLSNISSGLARPNSSSKRSMAK